MGRAGLRLGRERGRGGALSYQLSCPPKSKFTSRRRTAIRRPAARLGERPPRPATAARFRAGGAGADRPHHRRSPGRRHRPAPADPRSLGAGPKLVRRPVARTLAGPKPVVRRPAPVGPKPPEADPKPVRRPAPAGPRLADRSGFRWPCGHRSTRNHPPVPRWPQGPAKRLQGARQPSPSPALGGDGIARELINYTTFSAIVKVSLLSYNVDLKNK